MSLSKILKIAVVAAVIVIGGWLVFESISKPLAKKPKTIGALYFRQHLDAYEGLKEGMKKLGYTDKDVVYDEVLVVPGPNLNEDLKNGARKLIANKVDVLFVSMEHQAKIALEVTKEMQSDLPIVFMTRFHDPLAFGLIDSFKSSGNNSTGVATNLIEIVQKTMSFFKDINPKASRIGVFGEGFMVPGFGDVYLAEFKKQGPRFGLSIVEYKTQNPPITAKENWHEVADKIKPGDIDGLVHIAGHFYDPQETFEMELAKRLRIPMAAPSEDLPTGGSFAFSDNFAVSAEQVAVMIDKIFKGTKPSEIPIEFGSKSILILYTKVAREAGFTFPDSMLSIAEVIIDE